MTGAWDYQYLKEKSAELCESAGEKPINLQQFTTQNAAELAVSSGRVEMVAAGSAKMHYMAKITGASAYLNWSAIRSSTALACARVMRLGQFSVMPSSP